MREIRDLSCLNLFENIFMLKIVLIKIIDFYGFPPKIFLSTALSIRLRRTLIEF